MLLEELQQSSTITHGKQREYFEAMLQGAHTVYCKPMAEVLPEKLLKRVKQIEIKKHQCYKNSTLICMVDSEINYVEGKMEYFGIPIDHAWNEYKGQYFDATREIALCEIPEKNNKYLCIGVYDFNDVINTINNTDGFYGGIWSKKYHYKDKLKNLQSYIK